MDVSTPEQRKEWFRQGRAAGKTHMLVVCDTFSYEDYPIYVPGDVKQNGTVVSDIQTAYDYVHGRDMRKVMEVFDLTTGGEEKIDEPGILHEGVYPRALSEDLDIRKVLRGIMSP